MMSRPWRPGSHVFVRGRQWRITGTTPGEDCEALRLLSIGAANPGAALTLLVPFDRPIPNDGSPTPRVLRPRRWLHELDRVLADVHPFGALRAAAHAEIRLMSYQLEPALAVLRGGATRVLIADAVGMGKTIQAGLLLAELHARDEGFRGLVLAPAGLRDQWSSELLAHFALVAVVADAVWLRRTVAERPRHVNPWSLPGIYISSHDFVKRPEALRPLEDVDWDLVIVDEAHHAGAGTDRRAAIDAIASRSPRVLLLTATPPGERSAFDALCRIGRAAESEDPPIVFARNRDADGDDAGPERRTSVLAVTPSPAEARMHMLLERYSLEVWREAAARNDDGARLASIVLRKRALSSAGSLAASVERRIALLVSPDAEQMRLPLGEGEDEDEDPLEDDVRAAVLAAPGLADGRRERRWLAAIAEAARAAARAETKLLYLVRLLRRIREPVIVFTEYRDTLLRLHRALSSTGRSIVVLHGGMDPAERSRIPSALRGGALTLLATDAAAEGLNLHHRCRIVIHYELPWSPSRLEQRAGRVDRIGQTRRVHEIALVAASTAERLVVAPLTIRAARTHSKAGRNRLLDVLAESRVAEAVMRGVARVGCEPQPAADSLEQRFQADAAREVERLTNVRALQARSATPASRSRRSAPFVTRLRLGRSDGSTSTAIRHLLVLLYSLALETEDGRQVHDEVVVLGAHTILSVSSMRAAALRSLVQPYVNPSGSIEGAIDAAGRRAVQRVGPLDDRLRQLMRDRRQAVEENRRSAARRLVQLGLFARRNAEPEGDSGRAVPPSDDRLRLHARTRLVAAILIDGSRRSPS